MVPEKYAILPFLTNFLVIVKKVQLYRYSQKKSSKSIKIHWLTATECESVALIDPALVLEFRDATESGMIQVDSEWSIEYTNFVRKKNTSVYSIKPNPKIIFKIFKTN